MKVFIILFFVIFIGWLDGNDGNGDLLLFVVRFKVN